MERVTKAPEVRKQELLDVALALFMEKGFEEVSVRDILGVVNGHPGMFYYYFRSKQDIYQQTMEQFIQRELESREKILCDQSKPSIERAKEILIEIKKSILFFNEKFPNADSDVYQKSTLLDMLTAMAQPISKLLLELHADGYIKQELDEEKAYAMALFMIHGWHGVTHFDYYESKVMQFLESFVTNLTGIEFNELE